MSPRKKERIHTRQLVRYHVLAIEGSTLEVRRIGTTLASDVSLDGMFLSHAELKPGTTLHFYFELPTGYIEAVGKVVHNESHVDAAGVTRPGSGVRFIRMSDTDRARLEAYVAGRSRSHRIPEAGVARP